MGTSNWEMLAAKPQRQTKLKSNSHNYFQDKSSSVKMRGSFLSVIKMTCLKPAVNIVISLETLSILNKLKNKTKKTTTIAIKKLYLSKIQILSRDS